MERKCNVPQIQRPCLDNDKFELHGSIGAESKQERGIYLRI